LRRLFALPLAFALQLALLTLCFAFRLPPSLLFLARSLLLFLLLLLLLFEADAFLFGLAFCAHALGL